MQGVLKGLRVLDFGRYIAGPYVSTLLAEFGAEVIRIEKVAGSEDRYMTPVTEDGMGALFMQINRNKRGMTLNPIKEEGREIVRKLVETADIVVANLPPQGMKAMGVDYESLKAIKSDIILTTVSAFGEGGPYSDRVGFDGIGQVMSGAVYMSGTEEQPVKYASPVIDFGTAKMATIGTLLAVMHRNATGEGQMVEGSLLRTAINYNNGMLIEQAMIQSDRIPTLNRGQTAGPVDIVKTKDGWIIVQCIGAPLFKRWCELVGKPELFDDPRFADDLKRGDNGEELTRIANEHAKDLTTEEALAAYAKAMVPAGPVLKPQQVLDDPHVKAMGYMQDVMYPSADVASPVATAPVRMTATPGEINTPAPELGQHTDEIMAELGYDAGTIQALRDKRVI